MRDLVAAYRRDHPTAAITVIYGASGTLTSQIEQGAPFDLFFSADSAYPRRLIAEGDGGGPATPYAIGHLVLWSASIDMRGVRLADLARPQFGRIAIANPAHAPYGQRAEQALRAAGLWTMLQSRLVYGETIGQTAELARSGAAQVGIFALSLALDPAAPGSYAAVPDSSFQPLVQSCLPTRRGKSNALAQAFTRFVQGATARAILDRAGFTSPAAGR